MENQKQFMIVTQHNVYICEDWETFRRKTNALNTLYIPFNYYCKVNEEWVNLSSPPNDKYCATKRS